MYQVVSTLGGVIIIIHIRFIETAVLASACFIDRCSVESVSAKARERHRGGGRAHIVVDVRAEEMRAIQMWIAEWKITHPDGVVGPWSRVESLQLHSSVEK